MKIKNNKTGEIGYLIVDKGSDCYVVCNDEWYRCGEYKSLAELNAEWEDYEEPIDYWYINTEMYEVDYDEIGRDEGIEGFNKSIGNWFKTKEEAEKVVEKLKAWKRLKDKGFKFELWDYDGGNYQERIKTGRILFRVKDYEDNDKDLDLLFSQEKSKC